MSNTNTNSFDFEVAPYTDEPETLPETEECTQTNAPAPKKKKKCGVCRLFSFLLIAVSVLALFLPVQVLKGFQPESATLFASLTALFGGGATSSLFNVLPVYTDVADVTGMFAGLVFYALLIAIVCTVLFGLIALLSGNVSLFRVASFFFATGFGAYAICGYALPAMKGTADALGMDVIMVAIAGLGALLYLTLSFVKKGARAFASLIQFIFTLVFVAATVLILKDFTAEVTTAVGVFGLTSDLALQIIIAVLWVVSLLGAIRLLTKKGLPIDMIRYIVQFIVGALLVYVALTANVENGLLFIYALVAAVVSLVQIIFCIMQMNSGKPKKEKKNVKEKGKECECDLPVAQPVSNPVSEYTVEEYAEALPYDGGPVEGVEIAQEVNPTFAENPIVPGSVNTAGYDFYNSKSFDPFIAILNNEERNQFTELFILKYQGTMPEIPDYQVGGNNKEFFCKLFIYLGQYRDRIPDGLLAKIYQFAIRNT